SLHVNKGCIACLLGSSGCGKTTVLRAIAGFEPVTQGEIVLDGSIASRPGFTLPPEKRRLGMVFQDYALFPHMDVTHNVCFGLRGMSSTAKRNTAAQLLATVGLADFGGRYPHELSGGQQQRVALARALAARPALILMDEPFSNLDVELRERLGLEVRDVLKEHNIAAVLVTHDQQEAFALGDMIGIMQNGQVIQWDTPLNIYHEPANRYVADFIGQGVFLSGTVLTPDSIQTEVGVISGDRAYPWERGSKVDVLLRPDDVLHDPKSSLQGNIVKKAFKGAEILYTLRLATGTTLLALFPSHYDYPVGERVGLRISAHHLVAFVQEAG
ncbi:MAG TPA: ABC transporter ATP-binding protein, partial [Gammaproteobacteria bacterium]|nr:ABC transporter ATP-binding protein [Gammaproteobacteria bacterium]